MESTKYTKEQILKSKRYEHLRDVLRVALTDDESYTLDETDEKVKAFLSRPVVEQKNA